MKFICYPFAVLFLSLAFPVSGQETTIYNSPYDFEITNERLSQSIESNGFTRENISVRSYEVKREEGLMRLMHFEFDNGVITSQIIACEPTATLDLPFRIMVWEEEGEVFIAYVDTVWLKRRFLIKDCEEVLKEYNRLLIRVANETIRVN